MTATSVTPRHWKTTSKRTDGPTPRPTAPQPVLLPHIAPCLRSSSSTSPKGPTPSPCTYSRSPQTPYDTNVFRPVINDLIELGAAIGRVSRRIPRPFSVHSPPPRSHHASAHLPARCLHTHRPTAAPQMRTASVWPGPRLPSHSLTSPSPHRIRTLRSDDDHVGDTAAPEDDKRTKRWANTATYSASDCTSSPHRPVFPAPARLLRPKGPRHLQTLIPARR
ncbi:hypothetical protein BD779DRAFT_995200 [Infundibulicybe gibba]|nr:hypothetical protein BD779DRAFT_995200 [Infundibulicybe gibba]